MRYYYFPYTTSRTLHSPTHFIKPAGLSNFRFSVNSHLLNNSLNIPLNISLNNFPQPLPRYVSIEEEKLSRHSPRHDENNRGPFVGELVQNNHSDHEDNSRDARFRSFGNGELDGFG